MTKIKGVKSAKANKEAKNAKVVYDPKQVSPAKIVQTFNQTNGGGYTALLPKTKSKT